MTDGDGWMGRQRAREGGTREGQEGLLSVEPAPPSPASRVGEAGLTLRARVVLTWTAALCGVVKGRLINAVDSQHGWCLVFQGCCGHRHLLVLLALVLPQQAHGDRRGWARKMPCASQAVPGEEPAWGGGSQFPGVADPHIIDALVGWHALEEGIQIPEQSWGAVGFRGHPPVGWAG